MTISYSKQIYKKFISLKNIFKFFKKRKDQSKKEVNFENCDHFMRRGDNYYISFRILNRCGYYFQSIICLLLALEMYLKLAYIIEKKEFTDLELKKYGHNLKKLFKKTQITKREFPIIFQTINAYHLTDIRYKKELVLNELNHSSLLKQLHNEIINLKIKVIGKNERCLGVIGRNEEVFYKLYKGRGEEIINFVDECLKKGDDVCIAADYT